MDPSPSLWGSSFYGLERFRRKTKIKNWLQFSIFNELDFRRKQKNEAMSRTATLSEK